MSDRSSTTSPTGGLDEPPGASVDGPTGPGRGGRADPYRRASRQRRGRHPRNDRRCADRGHRAVPAGARWPARLRGRWRLRVPPRLRMGLRRLPRRRSLLRSFRLPDHEPPARRVGGDRPDQAWGVLGPTGPEAATRALPRPRRDRRLRRLEWPVRPARLGRPGRPAWPTGRRPGHVVLRRQLACDLRPPVLFRPVLRTVAARAHLVAGDRRAVLPRLAAGAALDPHARPWRVASRRDDRDRRRRARLPLA